MGRQALVASARAWWSVTNVAYFSACLQSEQAPDNDRRRFAWREVLADLLRPCASGNGAPNDSAH